MKQTTIIPTCITQLDAIEFPNDAHQAEALKLFSSLKPVEMMLAIEFWYNHSLEHASELLETEPVKTGHTCPLCNKPVMDNEDIAGNAPEAKWRTETKDVYHLACVERKLENERRFQAVSG